MAEEKTHAVKLAVPILVALFLVVCGAILVMRFFVSPRLSFGRLVVKPIPSSVHDIKLNRCEMSTRRARLNGERQWAVVLRFAVSKDDLSQIIAAHALKRVDLTEYTYGRLQYGFRDGPNARHYSEIELYKKRRPAPRWFDLEQWRNIETYVLERDIDGEGWMDVWLLLYNEQSGSAYFIRYEGNVVTIRRGEFQFPQ